MQQKEQTRQPYIDNLRAMIIILVVMVHTAVTYSGLGSWYYKENRFVDTVSTAFFGLFLSIAQSFDMSFLFMLAGYFIPLSFDVKGPARFVKDRLFRLGIPLLIYIIIIHPIAVKLVYPSVIIKDFFIDGIKSLGIFSWTGPLWFVLVLLILTVMYVIFRLISGKTISSGPVKINAVTISLLAIIIAIPAFLIRIVMPVGTSVMNLQFPYFSAYIVMFVIGIISKRLELFENIDYRTGKKWLIIALSTGTFCLLLLFAFGGVAKGEFKIFGGFTWQSFAFALWESFSCVALTVGLIGIFRNRYNTQNKLQKFLSDNYFGVYVFHAPILIAISVSLKWINIHPLIKFVFVAAFAIAASYLFTFLVRKIYFMKRIFS